METLRYIHKFITDDDVDTGSGRIKHFQWKQYDGMRLWKSGRKSRTVVMGQKPRLGLKYFYKTYVGEGSNIHFSPHFLEKYRHIYSGVATLFRAVIQQ